MSGLILPNAGLVVPVGTKKKFEFSEHRDYVDDVFSTLGPLDDIDLHFGQVIVCKYLRETVGTMGLAAAEQTRMEDQYLGKVGIVLKMGPLAFKNRPGADFGGASPKIGDFVLYRQSDGHDTDIICLDGLKVRRCKVLEDADVKGVVKHPDRFW